MASVKLKTAAVFFAAGVAIACSFFVSREFAFTGAMHLAEIAATASPLLFLIAGVRVLYHPRSGTSLGLVAGLVSLPWFVLLERVFRNRLTNSWILLNLPDDGYLRSREGVTFAEWRIVAIWLLLTALACSILRLFPSRWKFGNSPMSEGTWPALVVSLLVITMWYATSVSPYRIPYIVDAAWPDITMLHVSKQGLQFHETGLKIWRDSRFDTWRINRRWFQYRFATSGARGMVPEDVRLRVTVLLQSPELTQLQTPPANPLRRWNDEGWYVLLGRSRVLAFVNGTEPPGEVAELFSAIERLPQTDSWHGDLKDVCLGFCYDPKAGLGFMFVNQRCHTDAHGTWCQ